jgi:hypothetical protein
MSRTIGELTRVLTTQPDLASLQESLQSAIHLEWSTLPPYLCGLWSITDPTGPVYDLVNSVVLEEMLHLGLACNMLTTIGGTPSFTDAGSVPSYPGPLPGGVRPELTVYLAGLSMDYVNDVYMQIEYPEHPFALATAQTYPTIGAFYDALLSAFQTLQPTITGERQLTASFDVNDSTENLTAIQTMSDVAQAITLIKEQGEGTSQSPDAVDFGGELAHYYRFKEIYEGFTLIETSPGTWEYKGAPIPFPAVYPVAKVPAGGYPGVAQVQQFDQQYTALITGLQAAWANGDAGKLNDAIGVMFQLAPLAQTLMQTPLPGGGGNYAPDFQLIPGAR